MVMRGQSLLESSSKRTSNDHSSNNSNSSKNNSNNDSNKIRLLFRHPGGTDCTRRWAAVPVITLKRRKLQ